MSAMEADIVESTDFASEHDYIELKSMEDVEALDQKQVLDYIEKLHGIIRKYDTRFGKYKQKLKHLLNKETKSYSEISTQTTELLEGQTPGEEEGAEKEEEQQASQELSATDAFSFVDEMRQAARHAENLNSFVYEPTSGMYYDPKTGYYYNAEYGLYYDGNTGCYYSYNEARDSYEFHSQAQVQANKAAKNGDESDADEEEPEYDVEFDEFGGVITDKATLKQIKDEKQKVKDRAAKIKRKAKKKHKHKKSKSHKDSKRRHKSKKRHKHSEDESEAEEKSSKRRHKRDVEDGELSQSSSSSSSSDSSSESDSEPTEENGVPVFKASGRFQDIAKKYPPSLRIIVQETNVEQLTVGSLHLITYKGGTLGREGEHDVIIPDVNVSKCHLKFQYDTKQGIYKCHDLGSRNGTVLNGSRMCDSKRASEAHDLVHGSVIQIAQTKLLCHVHEGNSTCGLCEPGLLIETQTKESTAATSASQVTVLSHKEQLKKLQKKYGLENEKFVESKSSGSQHNYNDRAATRRTKVGSSTDKEKTEVACVNTEIGSSNKGFKLLSKLGWQKGETLGKTNASTGLLTPINVVANEGTTGLGSDQIGPTRPAPVDKRKLANLKITQARYQRANDIFLLSDESE